MKIKKYDIIIIGAGSGGLNVAGFFSRIKLKVLLIDKSDERIGGDCLNTGCVPSKALIHVANQVYAGAKSRRFYLKNKNEDLESKNSFVDMAKIIDYIKSKQEIIRKSENPDFLKNKGIDYISGVAKFVDENTVEIFSENSISQKYVAKNIILATGSRARKLSIENDKSVDEYNNENIFDIKYLPNDFVFIGGGPINCELGQAFSRLGSKVTILNTGTRILEKESLEASSILEKQFTGEGIKIINNIKIEKIEYGKIFYRVENRTESISCNAIFVGIGRELNIENLDLEKANVRLNENNSKIIVDKYLRTTNKNIYTVGDVAGNYQFTHAAEMHAKIVINNLISPIKKRFDDRHIAWTTYTTPEVTSFGISEKLATENNFEILEKRFEHDDRAIVDENQNGFIKLFINSKGEIKGGTVIAKYAGEISGELILAMDNKINLDKFFQKVYPYPVAGRINKSIAGDWVSKKLTEKNISILKILYKIFG